MTDLSKTFSQLKKLSWLYLENNKLTALANDIDELEGLNVRKNIQSVEETQETVLGE